MIGKGKEKSALLDSLRKVLLAGVGAMVLAREEMEDLVNKLVERGEIAEKEGRELIEDVLKRKGEVEEAIDRYIKGALNRMGIPSKSDIDALSEKVAELSKKVDELKKT